MLKNNNNIIYIVLSTIVALQAHMEICDDSCPNVIDPVCGRKVSGETKTFPNSCVMNFENCELSQTFGETRKYFGKNYQDFLLNTKFNFFSEYTISSAGAC